MGEPFDPYRDALVVEESTVWPDDMTDLSDDDKTRIAKALHANPADAAELDYVRLHAGFGRTITVTPEDVERLKQSS